MLVIIDAGRFVCHAVAYPCCVLWLMPCQSAPVGFRGHVVAAVAWVWEWVVVCHASEWVVRVLTLLVCVRV